MSKDKKQQTTTIKGEITNITFRNSDGWAVFTVLTDDKLSASVKCTGVLAEMIDKGTDVTCIGKIENSSYGRQLKCEMVVPDAPDVSTDAGVIKLLQRLPGIGAKKAMAAVQKHGHEKAWKYALEDPEKIGVHKNKVEAATGIAASVLESYDTTVYLLGIGLTDNQAAKIYRIYGQDTKKIVAEQPYTLIEIEGFGFKSVDKIALKAGIAVGNPARINACIQYVLDDSSLNGGNIWHSGWDLSENVLETLTDTAMKADVPLVGQPDLEAVRTQVHFLNSEGKIVIKKGKVYSKPLIMAEERIFDFVGGAGG